MECAHLCITGKRPFGRPRWEDNVRIDLKEIGINARNWVDSAQDRNYWKVLANAALNSRELVTHFVYARGKLVKESNTIQSIDVHTDFCVEVYRCVLSY